MATPITKSLFPELSSLLSTPTETLMAQPIQAAAQDNRDTLSFLRGQVRGLGAQAQQNIGGLFGQVPAVVAQKNQLTQIVQQVQAAGIDIATPEGQIALAQELSKYPEFIGMATAMRQQAAEQAQQAGLTAAKTFQAQAAGTASLAQATRERTPAALEQADRIRLAELQQQYGATEGANRFRAERDEAGRRQAAAGVPAPGEVGIPTIKGAQDIVAEYTKGSKEKLDQILPLRTTLAEARNTQSGAAFEQLRGQLIKLVGDSQISNSERARITGSSGIVGDAVNKVNMLLTGVPNEQKFKEIDRIIASLEKAYSDKYNAGINKADTVLSQGKLAPETRAALLPNRYVSGLDRQAQQTPATVGGTQVFRDANGNTAIFENNKWVEVKLVNGKWTPINKE